MWVPRYSISISQSLSGMDQNVILLQVYKLSLDCLSLQTKNNVHDLQLWNGNYPSQLSLYWCSTKASTGLFPLNKSTLKIQYLLAVLFVQHTLIFVCNEKNLCFAPHLSAIMILHSVLQCCACVSGGERSNWTCYGRSSRYTRNPRGARRTGQFCPLFSTIPHCIFATLITWTRCSQKHPIITIK